MYNFIYLMENIINNDFLKLFLDKTINNKKLLNLLFYGPPSCGKTTMTRLYLDQICESTKNYIEINSSDNRGINFYRDVLFKFINNNNIKNKIIFLDEADNLTKDSQIYINQVLDYINTNNMDTKFIIVCNYINKLNIDIINKCLLFRFNNMNDKSIMKVFNQKCNEKNLKITNKKNLVNSFNNDFRKLEQFFNLTNIDFYKYKNYNIIFKKLLNMLMSNLSIEKKYNKIVEILDEDTIQNILNDFFKYCLNESNIDKKKLIDIFYNINRNIGLDYNEKLKIYEIILSFNNI